MNTTLLVGVFYQVSFSEEFVFFANTQNNNLTKRQKAALSPLIVFWLPNFNGNTDVLYCFSFLDKEDEHSWVNFL